VKLLRYLWLGRLGWWKMKWRSPGDRVGIFRNKQHVGPGRWGFFVLGLEIGSRNPGDPVGMWLHRHGMWPW
jgi:hypothetical protein